LPAPIKKRALVVLFLLEVRRREANPTAALFIVFFFGKNSDFIETA